eukprot:TRINITY_DN50773_c0_g1_i1.p1 TRINITY_DN50773_c0_g1~~TRINITY_DN50773_c0_g1_i1.p1  ORF type:complete len:641 (-),score=108.46 TRINITY_DN50773_c0_g1_i1:319-2241(-)
MHLEISCDPAEVGFPSALKNLLRAQEAELHVQIGQCFARQFKEVDGLLAHLNHGSSPTIKCTPAVHPKPIPGYPEPGTVFEHTPNGDDEEVYEAAVKRLASGDDLEATAMEHSEEQVSEYADEADNKKNDHVVKAVYDDDDHTSKRGVRFEDECDVLAIEVDVDTESEGKLSFHRRDSEVAWKRRALTVVPLTANGPLINTNNIEYEETTSFASQWARRTTSLPAFEAVCACLICLNAFIVGLEVEYAASNETNQIPLEYRICEYLTAMWFVFELMLRLCSHGCGHFWLRSRDRKWNYLDAFVVGASLVDVTVMLTGVVLQNSVLLALKLVRVVRLARIIQAASVFHNLSIMVYSMIHTLQSLLCFLVLMWIITYCFATCLTQGVVDHFIAVFGEMADWRGSAEAGPDYMPRMLKDFGSVPRTMYTLLKCVTGGVSWGEPGDLVAQLGPMFMAMFLVFISFTVFAMLNVITGFFCEDAAASKEKDKNDAILQQLSDKDHYLTQFRNIFREMDTDRSGEVSLEELQFHIDDDNLQAYFAHLEIEVKDAWEIFRLLDVDASGTVSIEEFVDGCMRLRGYAKTLDVASITYDVERLRRKTLQRLDVLELDLRDIAAVLGVVRRRSSDGSVCKQSSADSVVDAR